MPVVTTFAFGTGRTMHKAASRYFDIPSCRNRSRTIKADGVEITASLTPADFPHRARLESTANLIEIGFVYAMGGDEERRKISNGPEHVELQVGVETGRVFQIQLPVPEGLEQSDKTSISVRVEPKLRKLKEQSAARSKEMPPHRRIAHYQAVSELMPMVSEELKEMKKESTEV